MAQRILERDARLIRSRTRRQKPLGRVDKKLRPPTHEEPFSVAYGGHMGDGQNREDWAGYLRRMTSRPGWSVARLSRESGIHRGTIFKWMSNKGTAGVNVNSVKAVAAAFGDDPANALRAAGSVEVAKDAERDEEIELVRTDPRLSPEMKIRIVTLIVERRERERQAALAETRRLIDLMSPSEEDGGEREAG